MATIYRHSRGKTPYFIGVFRDASGVWRHRSTRAKKRAEAERIVGQWQREADTLKGSTRLENKELLIESFIKATREAERGELTEATARRYFNELLTASGQGVMQTATIREYFCEWIQSREVSRSAGTARRYKQTVTDFLSFVGERADVGLGALVPRDIERFRDAELRAGKGPATVNLAVKTLRIPLNLARRQGLILTNAAEAVELLDNPSRTRGTFAQDDVSKLLATADWEWRGMILLGYFGGLRIGDAARLTWANVDMERRTVRLMPQKTARKRREIEVPLTADLEQWVLNRPGKSDKPDASLFPTLSTMKPGGCNGLSARFRKLMKAAGVDAEEDAEAVSGKGRKFHAKTFHALRHSFISALHNAGVTRELRMKLAGHTSGVVHERYSHTELATLRDAVGKLPSFGANHGARK